MPARACMCNVLCACVYMFLGQLKYSQQRIIVNEKGDLVIKNLTDHHSSCIVCAWQRLAFSVYYTKIYFFIFFLFIF